MQLDYRTFGERVLIARRRRRLTQRFVADQLHVSSTHIGDIERGVANPTYAIVVALCAILDIAEPDSQPSEGGEI